MKYTCPICGKDYLDPEKMAACASICAKKLKDNDKEKKEKIAKADGAVQVAYKNLQNAISAYKMAGGKTNYSASLFATGGITNCVFWDADGTAQSIDLNTAEVSYNDASYDIPAHKNYSSDFFGDDFLDLENFCKSNCNIGAPKPKQKKKRKAERIEDMNLNELFSTVLELSYLAEAVECGDKGAQEKFEQRLRELGAED